MKDYRPTYQVVCEHPVLLISPNFYKAAKKCRWFVTPAGRQSITDVDLHNLYLGKNPFTPCRYNLKKQLDSLDIQKRSQFNDVLHDYYMLAENGDMYPMFMLVACQKCELCINKKKSEWSARCQMECQSYEDLPLFITLTYDEECVPADGVSVRDCQLFFKNLRKRYTDCRLRYILVSEYGSRFHRPHYHIVLWGVKISSPFDTPANRIANELERFSNFCDFVGLHGAVQYVPFEKQNQKPRYHLRTDSTNFDKHHDFSYTSFAWKYGHVDIQQCVDTNASKYCCKYMHKKSKVPEGKAKTFMLCSRGEGGIGYPFLRSLIGDLRRFPTAKQFTYPDIHNDMQIVDVFFSPYLNRKIFPSYDQCIKSEYRNLINDIENENETILKHCDLRLDPDDRYNWSNDPRDPYQWSLRSHSDIVNNCYLEYGYTPVRDVADTNLPTLIHKANNYFFGNVLPHLSEYIGLSVLHELRNAAPQEVTEVAGYLASIREHKRKMKRPYDKIS